jgi:hypothetical protein
MIYSKNGSPGAAVFCKKEKQTKHNRGSPLIDKRGNVERKNPLVLSPEKIK